jgi:hypothetical protein
MNQLQGQASRLSSSSRAIKREPSVRRACSSHPGLVGALAALDLRIRRQEFRARTARGDEGLLRRSLRLEAELTPALPFRRGPVVGHVGFALAQAPTCHLKIVQTVLIVLSLPANVNEFGVTALQNRNTMFRWVDSLHSRGFLEGVPDHRSTHESAPGARDSGDGNIDLVRIFVCRGVGFTSACSPVRGFPAPPPSPAYPFPGAFGIAFKFPRLCRRTRQIVWSLSPRNRLVAAVIGNDGSF